ncbi:MAG: WD40/YVTN/BNR-like repeat-containing protein [Gaiellaceae bacterium]
MAVVILVGTRKGLFLLRGDDARRQWTLEEPTLSGWEVFHAMQDPRDGTLYAATNSWAYGPTVHRSEDAGQSWMRAEEIGLPEQSGLKLEKSWHVESGTATEPDTVFLGAAPGVLLRSDDRGSTWKAVPGILEHPTRERWHPGAGGMCCHSIQLDPLEDGRLYVGISAAGVFRTEDGGETWAPANKGTAADFLPEKYPELGQCVHKLLLHPERPDRLWQQNHCGVYRSDDRGESWERLDGNGLPSDFGFGLALHPRDPDTAFVIPEDGAENRVVADGRLGVYRTRDAGASWELLSDGLPERAWTGVLREGMASDRLEPAGVYVGTQSGSVYVTPDEGGAWIEAASQLPPILSIEVASTDLVAVSR